MFMKTPVAIVWRYCSILVFILAISFSASFAQISVTATAGTTSGSYTTLGAAVTAINAGTHQGVINISVTANTSETSQIVLNSSGAGSASYQSIRIKPAPSTTPTISGTVALYSILKLNGADSVTIDGSNTVGGTSRDLTIKNNSAASSETVIWIASASSTDGATNNTIKNCVIQGGSSTNTLGGVVAGDGAVIGNAAIAANSYNTLQNNKFTTTQNGFYLNGYTGGTFDVNWVIKDNLFTSNGARGLLTQNTTNLTIANNTVTGLTSNAYAVITGMFITGQVAGGNIYGNNINNINNAATWNGCNGLWLSADNTGANLNVYNNIIYAVWSTTGWPDVTYADNGYAVLIDWGGGYNIYHNTFNLTTTSTAGIPSVINVYSDVTAAGAINLQDNLIINSQSSGGTRYGLYCSATSSVFASINYNDYYSVSNRLGNIGGTTRNSLAAMITGFGSNANSINVNPTFVSTTDMHLQNVAANLPLAAGTPISTPSITTDYDGDARNATTPTIGADEIISNNISYTALTNTCSNGDVALNGVTITSGTGVPTTGTTVPQVYFKKGVGGTWYHSSGTLVSGTATSGTWNFSITASTMGGVAGGDVIYYYVIAQTTGGAVFASPSTGLVATDVNTVTTPPTTPNSYTVNAVSLTGLALTQTACYSPLTATSATFAYTGSLASPNQYTLTWSPAGPTDVTAFTALPASPISVSIPGGTAANTYTGTLTIKNSTTGCTNTYTLTLTINPAPLISGLVPLCPGGATTTLTGSPTGGSWSGGSTSVATIGASGMVTSVAAGTTIFTYTAPTTACTDTALFTVISAPSAITGSTSVCVGGVVTLGETTLGGSWSSSLTSRATVDAASGAVYGVSAGAVTITYMMPSGCYVTYGMTVGSAPAAITGPTAVCPGSQISLNHPVTTGTWSIAPLATATITTGGVVGGASAGTANVTYTLSPGCVAYANITVNPLPDPIVGPSAVCAGGATITLTDAVVPGSWSTTGSSAIATVNSSTGVVTGVGAGSVTVTYTASTTGCRITTPITVNALPLPITGATTTVCSNGATINLSDVSGPGTWSSGDMAIATVGTTSGAVYGVSAGVVPITFTNTATTCFVSININVIPVPAAIGGTPSVCASGGVTTLTDATTPGTWSISSGGFASISSSGVVTGNTAGSATVTYTGANSCYVTQAIVINPLPSAITGTFAVCQLAVTTLSSAPGTGSWSTASAAIATVIGGGGVRGVSPGTTTITYTLPTGCRTTASVTVNEIPAAIEGSPSVCLNGITTLSNTVTGGAWSSSALAIATVEATTGIVHGVAVGAANISYTTGTNGCYALFPINVTGIVVPTVSLNTNPGTTICQDTLVTFTPTVTNGGASPLYVWSVNNVILAGTPTYSYHPHNGDLVRVWILSSYECAVPDTTSAWVTMTVNPIVTPGLTLATVAGGDTACAGALSTIVPLPVAGGSSPVYQWTVNGVPSGIGSIYTYIPNNGDVILCTMTSNAPCRTANTATATKLLTVSPLITPMVNISSSLGYTVCDGYPDVLTTSMYGGGTAPTYQWAVNGNPMGTGPVYTYAPANGDVVSVTMTSNFPCVTTPTATTNISLTVLPITQPVGVVTAQPGYIVPAGMNDTFTCTIVSGGGLAPTYQWYINNIPQAGATNSVYITNNLHTGDSVNCEVVNTDQCSGVSVFSYIHIIIGNNVGVHDLAGQGSNVMLVPNPNNGSFHVKGNIAGVVNGNIDVQVTDMLGKAVYMGKAGVVNGVVDSELQLGDDLANGTYLLTIRNGEEQNTMHFTLQR
jgi:hypothetical protein